MAGRWPSRAVVETGTARVESFHPAAAQSAVHLVPSVRERMLLAEAMNAFALESADCYA